jgi:hypothetical protein
MRFHIEGSSRQIERKLCVDLLTSFGRTGIDRIVAPHMERSQCGKQVHEPAANGQQVAFNTLAVSGVSCGLALGLPPRACRRQVQREAGHRGNEGRRAGL